MFAMFPRAVTDCFVVAFRLPNMFRRLFGEGSLSVSFIPVYVEARHHSDERARKLSDSIFTIVLAISIFCGVVSFVYMDQILWYLVGDPRGFAAVPGKVEQTIYLARIMIFYLVLVTTYAFHMAIANTLGHFFIPALGPTLFNFGLNRIYDPAVRVGRLPWFGSIVGRDRGRGLANRIGSVAAGQRGRFCRSLAGGGAIPTSAACSPTCCRDCSAWACSR